MSYWTNLLWSLILWWWLFDTAVTPTSQLNYNSYDFERIKRIQNRHNRGDIELWTYTAVRTQWQYFDYANIIQKNITVEWKLRASSSQELEDKMHEMKRKLQEPNKVLYRQSNGSYLQTYATATRVDFLEEYYHLTFMPYIVDLTILDPFFYWDLQEEIFTWITDNVSLWINLTDWDEEARPMILLDFKTWTTASSITVSLNDEPITVQTTLTDWTALLIDHWNESVRKSWIVEYDWDFTNLKFGNNVLKIEKTWTINVDIYVYYYLTYA